jgi:hypothetical protein
MKYEDTKAQLRKAILHKDVSKVERILENNRQLRSQKQSGKQRNKVNLAQILTSVFNKVNSKKNKTQLMENGTHGK